MIKKFYQWVRNENNNKIQVLDFHALSKENCQMNFILSERARQGKTTSGLNYIIDRYLKHNEIGVLLLNIAEYFKKKEKLIQANKLIYPEKWNSVIVKSDGLYKVFKDDKGKKKSEELFCHFVACSQPAKWKIGTRDPRIKTIIYDEFNEGLERFDQVLNFNIILRSCSPQVQVFIFGNQLSVAVPLLNAMGFTKIQKELEFSHFGNMKSMFYVPRTTTEIIKALDDEKNWLYDFSKKVGFYEMDTLNKTNLDNNIGVVPEQEQYKYMIFSDNEYVKLTDRIYGKIWMNEHRHYFIEYKKDRKGASQVLVFLANQIEMDVDYNKPAIDGMRAYLENKMLFFSNYIVKKAFIMALYAIR